MTRRVTAVVVGTLLGTVVLAGAFIATMALLFEASDIRRGSLAYYLGVPASIRAASQPVEECRPAVFRWRGRDGLSAPFIALQYGSRAAPETIRQSHVTVWKALACQQTVSTPPGANPTHAGVLCQHPDVLSADVLVTAHSDGCHEVAIEFTENY